MFGFPFKIVGAINKLMLTAYNTFHQGFCKCYHNT